MAPVADAFRRLWPAAELMNVLDDRLSADLARGGVLDDRLTQRFIDLAHYVKHAGARGILFTCSAFGPAIEAAGDAVAMPTYKPNEAMFLEALAAEGEGGTIRVGLLTTFAPSVASMRDELLAVAAGRGAKIELQTACAAGAMEALAAGDGARHDLLVAQEADRLRECDVVMLGQFSMARAHDAVAVRLGKRVLTSPDSAVRLLQKSLSTAT
jgi:hypothetical protein